MMLQYPSRNHSYNTWLSDLYLWIYRKIRKILWSQRFLTWSFKILFEMSPGNHSFHPYKKRGHTLIHRFWRGGGGGDMEQYLHIRSRSYHFNSFTFICLKFVQLLSTDRISSLITGGVSYTAGQRGSHQLPLFLFLKVKMAWLMRKWYRLYSVGPMMITM